MGSHLTFYLLLWFGHGWVKHFNKLLYLFVPDLSRFINSRGIYCKPNKLKL